MQTIEFAFQLGERLFGKIQVARATECFKLQCGLRTAGGTEILQGAFKRVGRTLNQLRVAPLDAGFQFRQQPW